MKKITVLAILAIAIINFSFAQTQVLFGTCSLGGTANGGTIFQADLSGNNLHTVHSFVMAEGTWPLGKIAQAPNGKIYGVTYLGGCADSCTLYEYDPIADTCIDVYDFYCTPPVGEPSEGGLIILPDGNLYGCQQNGIIYKFNPNTYTYTLLQQTTGAVYYGGLTQASDGKLYGAAYNGGTYNLGYIFSYDLAVQTYSFLYSLDSTHGSHPHYENLIQATDGKLYGTTTYGGANNAGVIFSYDVSANVYTDLYDFDFSNGAYPYSGLVQATNGKLYGMTNQGGSTMIYGVIFSYDISASQYSVLHNFDDTTGSSPVGGLTQASNGKLLGTAHSGGTYGGGVAFSYDIAASTYTVLANFDATTGQGPTCDIQEATLTIPQGITSASISPASIYIDPLTQQLTVQESAVKANSQLVMVDAHGKKVLQAEINNQKSQFDLSSFPRGIYVVQLKSDKEAVTQKVILSK